MSEFSDLLSSYIDEKEIKVYSLLEYCNIDRSTMYKIINGKRSDFHGSIPENCRISSSYSRRIS